MEDAYLLERKIASERPGKEVTITLSRGGEEKSATVVLGTTPTEQDAHFSAASALLSLATKAVQDFPVQLTAEQAQSARDGILEALRRSYGNQTAQGDLANAVEALAAKLTDEAKADMLGLARFGLAAVGSRDLAIRWAKSYEALLPLRPQAATSALSLRCSSIPRRL